MIAGLKRDIKEELEIDIKIGDPFAVFDYANLSGGHTQLNLSTPRHYLAHRMILTYIRTTIRPPSG